jgi:hypothetical protein
MTVDASYVSEQLQQLTEQVQAKQSMGPNEVKQQKTNDLYNDMLRAQANALDAPAAKAEAEKAYYMSKGTYDSKLKRDAVAAKEEFALNFRTRMKEIDTKLDSLKAVSISANNFSNMYLSELNKLIDALNKTRLAESSTTLNNRKTYYLNQQNGSVIAWTDSANLMFVTLAIIQIKHMIQAKSYAAWEILILVSIVASVLLSKGIYYLLQKLFRTTTNVYTTFPEPDGDWAGFKI